MLIQALSESTPRFTGRANALDKLRCRYATLILIYRLAISRRAEQRRRRQIERASVEARAAFRDAYLW